MRQIDSQNDTQTTEQCDLRIRSAEGYSSLHLLWPINWSDDRLFCGSEHMTLISESYSETSGMCTLKVNTIFSWKLAYSDLTHVLRAIQSSQNNLRSPGICSHGLQPHNAKDPKWFSEVLMEIWHYLKSTPEKQCLVGTVPIPSSTFMTFSLIQ